MLDQMKSNTDKKVFGILGGGQLAALLCEVLKRENLPILIYAQSNDEPACNLATEVIIGEKNNKESLIEFFQKSDYVLLESEFYSPDLLKELEEKSQTRIYPPLSTYQELYSKADQKNFYKKNEIPNVKFHNIKTKEDFESLDFDGPYMVKVSHGGYDGYGNFVIESKSELTEKIETLSKKFSVPLVIEQFIKIKSEFACQIIVGKEDYLVLPPCRTIQEDSICRLVQFPAELASNIEKQLENIMQTLGKALNGPGIYAFEFFETMNGEVLVNEAAPRVHNSYHFSIEGLEKSQFELFIDAVLEKPLISKNPKYSYISMINLLGHSEGEDFELALPKLNGDFEMNVHMYGKKVCKPGRKMGHITLYGNVPNFEYAKIISSEYKL